MREWMDSMNTGDKEKGSAVVYWVHLKKEKWQSVRVGGVGFKKHLDGLDGEDGVRTFSSSRILDHTTGSHCLSVPRPIKNHVAASEDGIRESSSYDAMGW